MPDLQRYPWNLNLIESVEDNVVFLKSVYFCEFLDLNKKCASHFCWETANENKHFKKHKNRNLIHTWSDKAFKDTVLNRVFPSVHGGSLRITLTVPLSTYLIDYKGIIRELQNSFESSNVNSEKTDSVTIYYYKFEGYRTIFEQF